MGHKDIWKPKLFSWKNRERLRKLRGQGVALKIIIFIVLILFLSYGASQLVSQPEQNVTVETRIETEIITEEVARPLLKVEASNPTIIGRYGNHIQWYGREIKNVTGTASLNLDLTDKFGQVVVTLNDTFLQTEEGAKLQGDFRIEFTTFEDIERYTSDGMATDIEVFGNTGRGADHLPLTRAYLSAFARVNMFLDNQLLYTDLIGHVLITEGMRRSDGTLSTPTGHVYQHQDAADRSFVDSDDRELQFYIYSEEKDPQNFPEKEVFLNILFEEFEVLSKPKEFKI